jgi:hypothetical protein
VGKHRQQRKSTDRGNQRSPGKQRRVTVTSKRLWAAVKVVAQIAVAQLAAWALRRWTGT